MPTPEECLEGNQRFRCAELRKPKIIDWRWLTPTTPSRYTSAARRITSWGALGTTELAHIVRLSLTISLSATPLLQSSDCRAGWCWQRVGSPPPIDDPARESVPRFAPGSATGRVRSGMGVWAQSGDGPDKRPIMSGREAGFSAHGRSTSKRPLRCRPLVGLLAHGG